MAEQKQTKILTAVLACSTILAAVIIWTGCKKQPSEQADTEQARSQSPQSEQIGERTEEPSSTDAELFTRSKGNLKEVIDAARTWGPASNFQSWFGKPAPEFTLPDITGTQHKLSDYRGKNVMIIFWAIWCGPCRMEIPGLIELRNAFSKDKLAMLAISNEGPALVKTFAAQQKINYTVFSNQQALPAPFNLVNAIPCSFFIDPQGNIKLATVGLLPLSDMKAILQTE